MSDKDQLEMEGITYLSSRAAAKLFGYAQDYVGQLARSKQIDARRIGGMWYVRPESLKAYKEAGVSYQAPAASCISEIKSETDSDRVVVDGVAYILASQAASVSGYTQDYVTQLARKGSIDSKQVGGRWFVRQAELLKHKTEKQTLLQAVQTDSVGLSNYRHSSENQRIPTYSEKPYFNYTRERVVDMPIARAHVPLIRHEATSTNETRTIDIHVRPSSKRMPAEQFENPKKGTFALAIRLGTQSIVVGTIILCFVVGVSALRRSASYASTSLYLRNHLNTASVGSVSQQVGELVDLLFARKNDFKRQ